MPPPTCVIEFKDNPENVVYAGTVATCAVQLTFTWSTTVRSAYIDLSGVAYGKTKERRGQHRRTYKCDKKYLERQTFIHTGS